MPRLMMIIGHGRGPATGSPVVSLTGGIPEDNVVALRVWPKDVPRRITRRKLF